MVQNMAAGTSPAELTVAHKLNLTIPSREVHLLVDQREKAPRDVIKKYHSHIEWTTLQAGDYACSFACCGFERKEKDFNDMKKVLIQTSELISVYPNHYLVVNQDPSWVSDRGPRGYASRLAFISSLAVRGVPVLWCPDYEFMLDFMYGIIRKNHDSKKRGSGEFNHVRHVNKKDKVINLLTAFPTVGPELAERILDEFGSVANFVTADPSEWKSVKGIGIKTSNQIEDILFSEV